jgi:hypothetical protein
LTGSSNAAGAQPNFAAGFAKSRQRRNMTVEGLHPAPPAAIARDRDALMNQDHSSLEEFLASGRLQLGDIVLFRRKGSFFARNLTRLTGDYFSHRGLVFATPHTDRGFTKTYVLECSFSGVDITPFERFVSKRSAYVICIKRLERDWVDNRLRRAIRGHALNYIKAEYSFRTLTDLFLRAEAHMLYPNRRAKARRASMLAQTLRRGFKLPRAFICSGFVQFALFEAVRRAIADERSECSEEHLEECYFAAERWTDSLQADLLSVTPQDMADSPRLNWKYLIHQGKAFEVLSQDDVLQRVEQSQDGVSGFSELWDRGQGGLRPPSNGLPAQRARRMGLGPAADESRHG